MKKILICSLTICFIVSFIFLSAGCVRGESDIYEEGGTKEAGVIDEAEEAEEAEEVEEVEEVIAETNTEGPWTVGYSMSGTNVPYFKVMVKAVIDKGAEFGIEMLLRDGEWDASKQADQIEDLMVQGVDAFLINAADSEAIVPVLKKVQEAGYPIGIINSMIANEGFKYINAFTGPDEREEGRIMAEEVAKAFEEKGLDSGGVLMITGVPGFSAAIFRDVGFKEKLAELNPNIEILSAQPGNWLKDNARMAMEDMLVAYEGQFQAVYAHDDTMAVGAWLALEAAGYEKGEIMLFGIGGSSEGLRAIDDGIMVSTCDQSPQVDGEWGAELMYKILSGQEVEVMNFLPLPIIDKDNVAEFLPGVW